jgi:hypothetical protein
LGHVVSIRIFELCLAVSRKQNPNIHHNQPQTKLGLKTMADWDYVGTGSSIEADNLLQAAMKTVIELGRAENESNQEGGAQTAYVSYQVTGDAEKVFAATLTLPGRLTNDAATGEVALAPRNILAEFLPDYAPGTGTLADALHLSAAVVKLAKLLTYWERQVQSSIVTKTPNQTVISADLEASQFVITFNIPARVAIDATTGAIQVKEIDFLYILATQNV